MLGRIAEFLWMVAFWAFLLLAFIVPIALSYWRAREKAAAAETQRVLETLGFDTTHDHEQDVV